MLALLVLFSGTQFSFGKEMIPNIYLLSDNVDEKLSATEAVFRFTVGNPIQIDINKPNRQEMRLSLNGVWKTVSLVKNSFELKVEPGTYTFQFYLNEYHEEIYSGPLVIESKHKSSYQLTFSLVESNRVIMAEKPVVYCYAPMDTQLDISVKPVGDFSFTYPEMEGTWSGKVKESGAFEIGGITYPYLFWEANQAAESMRVNWSESSIIKGSETIQYLEEVCLKLGLTAAEKTDFITYWGPRMAQSEYVEVCVLIDDVSQLIGELSVSDPAFKVHRMYLVFRETEPADQNIDMSNLKKFDRSTNHILEWGGSEFPRLVN
jgi:hypothetical protein